MPGPTVLTISFGEEDSIELTWTDDSQHNDRGAWVVNEVITRAGQLADPQVAYWVGEFRQSADELLGAWRNYLRDTKVRR